MKAKVFVIELSIRCRIIQGGINLANVQHILQMGIRGFGAYLNMK